MAISESKKITLHKKIRVDEVETVSIQGNHPKVKHNGGIGRNSFEISFLFIIGIFEPASVIIIIVLNQTFRTIDSLTRSVWLVQSINNDSKVPNNN